MQTEHITPPDFEIVEPRWFSFVPSLGSILLIASMIVRRVPLDFKVPLLGAVALLLNYRLFLYLRTNGRVLWGKDGILYYRTSTGSVGSVSRENMKSYTLKHRPGRNEVTKVQVQLNNSESPVTFSLLNFGPEKIEPALKEWFQNTSGEMPSDSSENRVEQFGTLTPQNRFKLSYLVFGVGLAITGARFYYEYRVRPTDSTTLFLKCDKGERMACFQLAERLCGEGKKEDALLIVEKSARIENPSLETTSPTPCLNADPLFSKFFNPES
jgi:hypothetical protein